MTTAAVVACSGCGSRGGDGNCRNHSHCRLQQQQVLPPLPSTAIVTITNNNSHCCYARQQQWPLPTTTTTTTIIIFTAVATANNNSNSCLHHNLQRKLSRWVYFCLYHYFSYFSSEAAALWKMGGSSGIWFDGSCRWWRLMLIWTAAVPALVLKQDGKNWTYVRY
jgi:hypothetical protein